MDADALKQWRVCSGDPLPNSDTGMGAPFPLISPVTIALTELKGSHAPCGWVIASVLMRNEPRLVG
jgi:hypothetical protein